MVAQEHQNLTAAQGPADSANQFEDTLDWDMEELVWEFHEERLEHLYLNSRSGRYELCRAVFMVTRIIQIQPKSKRKPKNQNIKHEYSN